MDKQVGLRLCYFLCALSLLTHLCLASHKRDMGKQCRPRSDAANAASDQNLHFH